MAVIRPAVRVVLEGSVTNFFFFRSETLDRASGKVYGFDSTDLLCQDGRYLCWHRRHRHERQVVSLAIFVISPPPAHGRCDLQHCRWQILYTFAGLRELRWMESSSMATGTTIPKSTQTGSFTNWDTAVFVGGIAGDPNAPGADDFQARRKCVPATGRCMATRCDPASGRPDCRTRTHQ